MSNGMKCYVVFEENPASPRMGVTIEAVYLDRNIAIEHCGDDKFMQESTIEDIVYCVTATPTK